MSEKAVILFSGGLDSTTVLYFAKAKGYDCHLVSFDYHQRNFSEVANAKAIAQKVGVRHHHIFDVDFLEKIGGSALTDKDIPVPDTAAPGEIPVTYVPIRNLIFLSIATSLAEVIGAFDIFIGTNAIDFSNYPDCKQEFLDAFTETARLASKVGATGGRFKIHAPLQHLSKGQIIALGNSLGVPYRDTVTCYNANDKGEACGHCLSCNLRKDGFLEAGVEDPTRYKM